MHKIGMIPKIKLSLLLAIGCTILFGIFIIMVFETNKYKYSEIWITEVPIIKNPVNSTREDQKGRSVQLHQALLELKSKKDRRLNGQPWYADTRFKSSLVYINSTDPSQIDLVYDEVKKVFSYPIARVLPQEKNDSQVIIIKQIICLLIVYTLLMGIITSTPKPLYLSPLILLMVLILNHHIESKKEWINQREFSIKTPYPNTTLSYGHFHGLSALKSQIGELSVYILQGQNKHASFKMKSAHRLFNQKRRTKDATTIWVRSNTSPKKIVNAIIEAQKLVDQAASTIEKETKQR